MIRGRKKKVTLQERDLQTKGSIVKETPKEMVRKQPMEQWPPLPTKVVTPSSNGTRFNKCRKDA
ncbi:hypothetical protein KY290_017559 [Solanum tuberosum]|uniref:Uncharacterized protein n=1 Tax=Solanum tuberosum TaxID=4113 RepID=A0ABQ7VBR4_SOLTU|nr:hypothetical protein KY290_017559 [Solanum tuberosum]